MNGLIPFAPHTTWGLTEIPGVTEGFNGHLIQTGTLPIGKLPMELRGLLITDLDADEDGDTPFDETFYTQPDLRLGGNGDLFLAVPFLTFLSFEWPLGSASVSATFGNLNEAYFSGVLAPDDPSSLFTEGLPIPIAMQEGRAAGYIGENNFAQSFITVESDYSFDLTPMADLLALKLGAMRATEAMMRLDAEGLQIVGTTSDQLHALIDFQQSMEAELFISGDGVQSYLALLYVNRRTRPFKR